MENVTPDMFKTFIIVAAALVGFVLLIWQLIDRIRGASKPARELMEWRQKTDKRLDDAEGAQRVTLRGISALISHELNGNSNDKLQKSQEEIMNYLIDR